MKKFLTSVIVVALLLSLVCFAACSKETSFEKVVKCAKDMQDFMVELEDFESFVIDDDCGYKLGYDDNPFTVFIYIPFTATFTDGDVWEDVAYYASGYFVGYLSDFDDGSYEELDLDTQLLYLSAGLIYLRNEADEKFSAEDVTNALTPIEE